jgi:DNA-binding helix-hairpin-helix protein with protein kinase domain
MWLRVKAGAEPYVEGAKLGIGVLVVDALLEGAHGFLGLHRLGADDIGYLEVEGNVFTVDGHKSAMALSPGRSGTS